MTMAHPSLGQADRSLLGTADGPELVLRRRYRAAPSEVLAACTDLERLALWFGQVDGEPAAVGDTFTVRFQGTENLPATGEVLACATDGLSISWSWQGEQESVISLRVAAAGESESELTLLHVLSQPDHVAGYGGGWEQQLESLARHLADAPTHLDATDGRATGGGAGAEDRASGENAAAELRATEEDSEAERRAVATWEAMTTRPLEIRWHVPADLDRVWAALATTDGLKPWWWGHFPFVTIDADAAPGASYRITAPSAGIELEGTYLIVARPRRLSCTWQWSEAGISSQDETVDIALDPGDGGTVITLRHTGPWTDDQAPENYRQAWQATLAALEGALLP